jgi:hypothetical protein
MPYTIKYKPTEITVGEFYSIAKTMESYAGRLDAVNNNVGTFSGLGNYKSGIASRSSSVYNVAKTVVVYGEALDEVRISYLIAEQKAYQLLSGDTSFNVGDGVRVVSAPTIGGSSPNWWDKMIGDLKDAISGIIAVGIGAVNAISGTIAAWFDKLKEWLGTLFNPKPVSAPTQPPAPKPTPNPPQPNLPSEPPPSPVSDTLQQKIEELKNRYPAGASGYDNYGNASQCMGFAYRALSEIHGLDYSNTWMTPLVRDEWARRGSAFDVQPGDYVRYDSGYDNHSIVITGVDGDTVSYIQCNGGGGNVVSYGTMSKADLQARIDRPLRANYSTGGATNESGSGYISHP